MITHDNSYGDTPWLLWNKDRSKVLGKHTSRDNALKQDRAIQHALAAKEKK